MNKSCRLLVSGYIGDVEAKLDGRIIPDSIGDLCCIYYREQNILVYIEDDMIRLVDLNDTECKVLQRPSLQNESEWNSRYRDCSGMCCKRSCIIPSRIPYSGNNRYKDIVFQCGGICRAIIFDITGHKTFDYDLPALPERTYANAVVYSNHYGLISCGGQPFDSLYTDGINSVYNLPLNIMNGDDDDDDLKWNISMKHMIADRYYPSGVLINENNKYEEKLIVIGGFNTVYLDTVEMYDFGKNEWKYIASMNKARYRCGVCYDMFSGLIYIGGGFNGKDAMRSIECYDINKNKWDDTLIPNTRYMHDDFVNIWKHDNLLYISSLHGDVIECMDLRANEKRTWAHDGGIISDSLEESLKVEVATNYAMPAVALFHL